MIRVGRNVVPVYVSVTQGGIFHNKVPFFNDLVVSLWEENFAELAEEREKDELERERERKERQMEK